MKGDFDEFYQGIFGARWGRLVKAIEKSKNQKFPFIPFPHQDTPYFIDEASLYVAQSLLLPNSGKILDMCAAPGGKTLVLAKRMGPDSTLWSNDFSRSRRTRLKEVIRKYIPEDIRQRVFVKGRDAGRFGITYPESFDAILVDAPCSGEAHLLDHQEEKVEWGPKRTKRLAAQQHRFLCSAEGALKPGGSLVYSTCSLSPYENEEVVKNFLLKRAGRIELDLPSRPHPQAEEAEGGWMFYPDTSGLGPMFLSRFKKI